MSWENILKNEKRLVEEILYSSYVVNDDTIEEILGKDNYLDEAIRILKSLLNLHKNVLTSSYNIPSKYGYTDEVKELITRTERVLNRLERLQ